MRPRDETKLPIWVQDKLAELRKENRLLQRRVDRIEDAGEETIVSVIDSSGRIDLGKDPAKPDRFFQSADAYEFNHVIRDLISRFSRGEATHRDGGTATPQDIGTGAINVTWDRPRCVWMQNRDYRLLHRLVAEASKLTQKSIIKAFDQGNSLLYRMAQGSVTIDELNAVATSDTSVPA